VPEDRLTPLDRWILHEFTRLEQAVAAAYDAFEFHVVYQQVSQFAAVELSAVYHDVAKDRLYTDPADSPRRRSTQTALCRLVTGLCQMLAPVLAFTADEAWAHIPGRAAGSVHETTWAPGNFALSAADQDAWSQLMTLRSQALAALEQVRQTKVIGKALEARLTLQGTPLQLAGLEVHAEALRELLNVSQLQLAARQAMPAAAAPEGLQMSVEKAAGRKCARCWHWETDVGSHAEHAGLCGRCVAAVTGAVAAV
jgi:isoleucyl-tRNA synthetase